MKLVSLNQSISHQNAFQVFPALSSVQLGKVQTGLALSNRGDVAMNTASPSLQAAEEQITANAVEPFTSPDSWTIE